MGLAPKWVTLALLQRNNEEGRQIINSLSKDGLKPSNFCSDINNPLYLNLILDLDITFYFEESINLAYAQWKFDKPL